MSDIIQLLPDAIANQIAAGEVIQRPASVVKELMENSVDAGSSSIQLIIKDAGKTLIQVADNGCGMSDTDARLSFERHATSKIRKLEDIFSILTMGFRGEALASIAAIAQVELKTRQEKNELGTRIEVNASRVEVQEPCSHPVGTSISVKNLFFNVPARRSFLKSDPVEMRHIIDEFMHVAITHPAIFFSLHHNGEEVYHLRPGNLRQRIVAIFGANYNEKLVPVSEETDFLKIEGFIGKPEHARKTRGEQYFFLNNRFIKSPYLNHAVMSAYDQLLPERTFPFYALQLTIDPAHIDINVHPTKQEVKFQDERTVYMIVQAAVKHGLAQYSVTPTIDFDQEVSFSSFTNSPPGGQGPMPSGRPVSSGDWKKLYESDDGDNVMTIPSGWPAIKEFSGPEEASGTLTVTQASPIQLHRKYILSALKSGFLVIHQRYAHERILYEKFLKSAAEGNALSQRVLFPRTLELNASDAVLMNDLLPVLMKMGFDIQPFGRHAFVVHALPADIADQDDVALIENVIEQYKWNADEGKFSPKERVAMAMAREAGVKVGQQLDEDAMNALIDQLFACEMPNCTPGGHPTFITYALEEIDRLFNKR